MVADACEQPCPHLGDSGLLSDTNDLIPLLFVLLRRRRTLEEKELSSFNHCKNALKRHRAKRVGFLSKPQRVRSTWGLETRAGSTRQRVGRAS